MAGGTCARKDLAKAERRTFAGATRALLGVRASALQRPSADRQRVVAAMPHRDRPCGGAIGHRRRAHCCVWARASPAATCRLKVEIKRHLQELCDDLADLLFHDQFNKTIVVQSPNYEIPATLALPLGLIVNELITNSVKYAKSDITVRFESITPVSHSISVVDEGPGLPADSTRRTAKAWEYRLCRRW